MDSISDSSILGMKLLDWRFNRLKNKLLYLSSLRCSNFSRTAFRFSTRSFSCDSRLAILSPIGVTEMHLLTGIRDGWGYISEISKYMKMKNMRQRPGIYLFSWIWVWWGSSKRLLTVADRLHQFIWSFSNFWRFVTFLYWTYFLTRLLLAIKVFDQLFWSNWSPSIWICSFQLVRSNRTVSFHKCHTCKKTIRTWILEQ